MTAAPEVHTLPTQVAGLWTLASSMVHGGDETLGTTKLFRTKDMIFEGRRVAIPVVSGNAIRGLWRRACAITFLEIQRLLQRRCVYPPTRTLAVSDRERRLIAIIQPSDPSRDRAWPQVTTILRWRDFLFKEDGRPRRRKLSGVSLP